jgi:uncharacterized Ntn-hydrolase superfamily protein
VTFAIAARCAVTGAFGVAISSSSPAVGARCPKVRAGVGAASSQNVTDPRLGPQLLDRLAAGADAQAALDAVLACAPFAEHRQLLLVDAAGRTAAWTGEQALGITGVCHTEGAVAAGNLLAGPEVVTALAAGFADPTDDSVARPLGDRPLGDRLVAALQAALAAGGEAGPVHSAALLIATTAAWPSTDLRVDWDDEPIDRLAELWRLWAPQAQAYLDRANNPAVAPSYGVPGDE